jgi:hypothetical protein
MIDRRTAEDLASFERRLGAQGLGLAKPDGLVGLLHVLEGSGPKALGWQRLGGMETRLTSHRRRSLFGKYCGIHSLVFDTASVRGPPTGFVSASLSTR